MSDLILTDAERQQILKQRERTQRTEWIAWGIFIAADYLHSLGDQCAGGAGPEKNPETGLQYGESYYHKESLLRMYASNLQADWRTRI